MFFFSGQCPSCSAPRPTEAQRVALAHLRECVEEMGPPPSDLDGPGAFDELRSRLAYDGVASRLAPLRTDLLDLPPAGFTPVTLEQAAGEAGKRIEERLIHKLPPVDVGEEKLRASGLKRPYNDPSLRKRSSYL